MVEAFDNSATKRSTAAVIISPPRRFESLSTFAMLLEQMLQELNHSSPMSDWLTQELWQYLTACEPLEFESALTWLRQMSEHPTIRPSQLRSQPLCGRRRPRPVAGRNLWELPVLGPNSPPKSSAQD